MDVLCVMYIVFSDEANGFLYIIIDPTVNIMCYAFVIHILQSTNCKLTAKYVSAPKPATKVLSKLVAAAISVSCSYINFFQYQSICLLHITQSYESPVYVLPAAEDKIFKNSGSV